MKKLFDNRGGLVLALMAIVLAAPPAAAETASSWIGGFNNQARMIVGKAARPGEDAKLYAAIEIKMPEGWKTYWRSPGDAGGIPPEFDFASSENVAKATVLYPAPKKLVDRTGTTYGYKDHVIFPVLIEPADASKPVVLNLRAAYGVCEQLCVPAGAELSLTVEPDIGTSEAIAEALAHVPTKQPVQGKDPIVEKTERLDRSGKRVLQITASGGDASAIDAFVDSPDGIYLPVPKRVSAEGGAAVFELDLTDGVTEEQLKDKTISITLTGADGQSETAIKLPDPSE